MMHAVHLSTGNDYVSSVNIKYTLFYAIRCYVKMVEEIMLNVYYDV